MKISGIISTLLLAVTLMVGCSNGESSCTSMEYDGYTYDLVQIGDQCWFAENLRNWHYANGDAIPELVGKWYWKDTSIGARSNYENNFRNLATYGRLYNWHAVNDARGLCPSGWHVPTDGEYTTLTDGLGGALVAGEEMKSTPGDSPPWNGTNTSGFSGLAGGWRSYEGDFNSEGGKGYFWSASTIGAGAAIITINSKAWHRSLNDGNKVNRKKYLNDLRTGLSVRCVRD